MRGIRAIITGLVLAVAVAALPAPALAKNKPGHPAHKAAATVGKTTFKFKGLVAAAPGATASSLSVLVQTGNQPAANLLGTPATYAPANYGFPFSATTAVYQWAVDNKAKLSTASTLGLGDPVVVSIVARRDATLAQVLATPATRVDDVLNSTKPAGRFYFFTGSLVSVDPMAGKITVDLSANLSNWRARRSLSGQPTTQTFSFNNNTAMISWKGGKRHLLNPTMADLVGGDRVTLRIYSPQFDARISTLTSIPVWRVNDKEPLAAVRAAARAR